MTRSRNTGNLLSPDGSVLSTKVSYVAPSASASRTLEQKLSDWVSVEDYGAVGNGSTNSGPALNAAFLAAATAGVPVMFTGNATYLTTIPLTIPNGVVVLGNGCSILLDRSDSSNSSQVTLGDNCSLQDLSLVLGAGHIIERGVSLGDNCTLLRCSFESVDQNPSGDDNLDGFLQLRKNNCVVDGCRFINWDKPIFAATCNDNWIVNCYFEKYVRGIGLRDVESVYISSCRFNLKSPNATTDPGHNAIGGNGTNVVVDNVTVYEAGEHGFYFADDSTSLTQSVTITNCKLDQIGQCGIKIRGHDRVTVGNIHVIDCAFNSLTGTNEDGLRLEGCRNVIVDGYRVSRKNKNNSCYDGIHVAGCRDVSISSFYVDRPVGAGLQVVDNFLDTTSTASRLYVQGLTVRDPGIAGIAIGTTALPTGLSLSEVVLTDFNIIDPVSTCIYFNHTGTVTDPVSFTGNVHAGVGKTLVNNASSTAGLYFNLWNSDPSGERGAQVQNKLARIVNPQDFGAVGNGSVDDTSALTSFFNHIASTSSTGDLGDDFTYLFSELNIPSGVKLRGKSVLRCDGTTASISNVTCNGNLEAEYLNFTTVGTETNGDFLVLNGNDYTIGNLIVKSDVERVGTGGIRSFGNNIRIDYLETKNVPRGYSSEPANTISGPQATNVHLGFVRIDTYIRGLKFVGTSNWSVQQAEISGKDSRAIYTPGHVGVLIGQATDWMIGEISIEDSGEHGLRIGGTANPAVITERGNIDYIFTRNTGATGVKLNSASTAPSFGIKNVSFGQIVVIDAGQDGVASVGSPQGNQDGLRITDAENIYVGSFVNLAVDSTYSSNHSINLNSCNHVVIDSIYSENTVGNMLRIDKNIDGTAKNFNGLYINSFTGISSLGPVIGIEYQDGARTIGDLYIKGFNVSGPYDFVLQTFEPIIQSGNIHIHGIFDGASPELSLNSGASIYCDLQWENKKLFGLATANIGLEASQYLINNPAFDSSAAPTLKSSIFIDAQNASNGLSSYGGSLGLSRPGSGRRGAAVVSKQTGAAEQQVGLSFFTANPGIVGTDAVTENFIIAHDGQVFAGNGATQSIVTDEGHLQLRSYTTTNLPSATIAAQLIYVSDGTGNKKLAISDGSNWRFPDGNVVS